MPDTESELEALRQSNRQLQERVAALEAALEQPAHTTMDDGCDRTEVKLAELQILMRSIINSSSDMIWAVDAREFGLLSFNPSYLRHFHDFLHKDVRLGMRPSDLAANEEHAREWISYYEHALRDGSYATVFRAPGGLSVLDLHLDRLTRDGAVFGISAFARNIADQLFFEGELRESEERFRTLSANALIGIYIIQDNKITYVNAALERMLGYEPGELIEADPLVVVHPSDHALVLDSFQRRVVGDDSAGHFIFRGLRKGGEVRIIEVYSASAELGGRPATFGNLTDITERRHAEEALRESETRFRALAENSLTGIYIIEEGRLQYVNPAYARTFGYTPQELIGADALTVVHPDDRAQMIETISRRRGLGSTSIRSEFKGITKTGGARYIEFLGTPVVSGGRNIIVGNMLDVTTRKLANEERERLSKELRQAQKMEAIGRLAGGVAHDFNNLLTVILGHAEMAMQEVNSDSAIFSDLQELLNAAHRSTDLTRQLLAFARRQPVAPKTLDLNGTVSNMLKMLRRLMGENIELTWKPGDALWLVRIDPSQIDQILANLCVNARDAIADVGHVTIETSNAILDEAYCASHIDATVGEYVCLSVLDDGYGMDAETLECVFEPFFTTKPAGKGTGLGLPTVYGAVKQNSGHIEVQSELGKGTVFRIYLPRWVDESAGLSEDAPRVDAQRGTETILLVEDEPAILSIGRQMLQKAGYSVLAASTPYEALDLVATYPGVVHLLITDVVMPEMNGHELATRLMAVLPDLKLLYISGYTADVLTPYGVLNEGVSLVQKPFTLASLTNKVRQVLAKD